MELGLVKVYNKYAITKSVSTSYVCNIITTHTMNILVHLENPALEEQLLTILGVIEQTRHFKRARTSFGKGKPEYGEKVLLYTT